MGTTNTAMLKLVPEHLKKAALHLTVRELDEVQPGRYEAFVDDGDESYDVAIELDKGQLKSHRCDCPEATDRLCTHRAAVLLRLADAGKKTGQKTPATAKIKKRNPLEALVMDLPEDTLRTWAFNLLKKNKSLALEFTNQFTAHTRVITPEDITAINANAVKAVAKNRKRLDTTTVKQIVALLEKVHQPVIDQVKRNITEPASLLLMEKLLVDLVESYEARMEITSNKLSLYREGLVMHLVEPLHNLEVHETWLWVMNNIIILCNGRVGSYTNEWLQLLMHMATLEQQPERRQAILDGLLDMLKHLKPSNRDYHYQNTSLRLWAFFKEQGEAARALKVFKPFPYQLDYNLQLIDEALRQGLTDTAETWCKQQIAANTRAEFNLEYLVRLKTIYQQSSRHAESLQVIENLIGYRYSFEDYEYGLSLMPTEEDKKAWTKKWMAKVNRHLSDDYGAAKFHYAMCIAYDNYDRLLTKLPECCLLELIIPLLDKLYHHQPVLLFQNLVAGLRRDNFAQVNKDYYGEVWDWLVAHYTAGAVAEMVQSRIFYTYGEFYWYAKQRLAK
jgi:hypothetical protein